MESTNVVYIFIIVLVCGFLIIFLIFSNLLDVTGREEMLPETNIVITGEPVITCSGLGPYSHTITLPLEIEHRGKWEYGNYLNIIPLITFKGVDKKPGAIFTLTEADPSTEVGLVITIESDIGPIRKLEDYLGLPYHYEGPMMVHESIYLTTEEEGNFLVTLEEIKRHVKSLEKDITGAIFSVECEKEKRFIELYDWELCEEGNEYSEQYEYCERYLDMCEGTVHIALIGPTEYDSEPTQTDQVIIDAEGDKPFPNPDSVEVSLWESNSCVNSYDSFDELRMNCIDYFRGYATLWGTTTIV